MHRLAFALLCLAFAGCGGLSDEAAPDFEDPTDIVLHLRGDGCAPNIAGLATVVDIGDGLGVTVAHGFDDLATFEVVEADGTVVPAELLAMDRGVDLAVLSLDRGSVDAHTSVAPADDRLGETATVVTFSRIDDGPTAREADVLRRVTLTLDGEGRRLGYELGVDVAPGDSGGAVLDADGRLGAIVFASARGDDRSWSTASSELTDLLATATAAAADPTTTPLPLTCP